MWRYVGLSVISFLQVIVFLSSVNSNIIQQKLDANQLAHILRKMDMARIQLETERHLPKGLQGLLPVETSSHWYLGKRMLMWRPRPLKSLTVPFSGLWRFENAQKEPASVKTFEVEPDEENENQPKRSDPNAQARKGSKAAWYLGKRSEFKHARELRMGRKSTKAGWYLGKRAGVVAMGRKSTKAGWYLGKRSDGFEVTTPSSDFLEPTTQQVNDLDQDAENFTDLKRSPSDDDIENVDNQLKLIGKKRSTNGPWYLGKRDVSEVSFSGTDKPRRASWYLGKRGE